MGTILIIILILLLLGALPTWPYSNEWGYYPSGTIGTVLLIVLILVASILINAFLSRWERRLLRRRGLR